MVCPHTLHRTKGNILYFVTISTIYVSHTLFKLLKWKRSTSLILPYRQPKHFIIVMTLTILVFFAVANANGAEKITHILQKLRINALIPRSLDAIKSYKETRTSL